MPPGRNQQWKQWSDQQTGSPQPTPRRQEQVRQWNQDKKWKPASD